MLHQQIEAEEEAIPQAIADALEDVELEINEVRVITARMVGTPPDSSAYRADRGRLNEMVARIDSRARRVELPDGELTADSLMMFANVQSRRDVRRAPSRRQAASRALHEEYVVAVTAEADAARALTAAQVALQRAQAHRIAAEQAYAAHGASRLVR